VAGKGEGGEQGPDREEPALRLGRQTNRHEYNKEWKGLLQPAGWAPQVGLEDGHELGLALVPCRTLMEARSGSQPERNHASLGEVMRKRRMIPSPLADFGQPVTSPSIVASCSH
jgi:hypothetical protein